MNSVALARLTGPTLIMIMEIRDIISIPLSVMSA